MTTTESTEFAEIIQHIQLWPTSMRIALAQRILEGLKTTASGKEIAKQPRGPSAAEVAALFKTERAVPDDATVKQWMDEHRMEKYGK